MYSLFIDTHSDLIVIILYKDGIVLTTKKISSNQSHSNNLIPIISEALSENSLKPENINEVIVINGPGSFTGSRIGVTVAKTFAYALKLPIKTISSLEQKAFSSESKDLNVVVESDKNGYFIGLFKDFKLQGEMFYLSNKEFDEYIKVNNYEENIVDNINIDYQKLFDFIKNLPILNYHEVKPLYVKQIEALND